jgi:O-antigen/teichoic acid export membrane protein
LIKQLRGGKAAAAGTDNGAPRRRRSRLPRTYRNIAGNVGVSLITQLGLLLSGVAGARILGVLDRGRSALLLLFATVLPLLGTLGTPLAVTYWIAREKRAASRIVRRVARMAAWQVVGLLVVHALVLLIVFGSAPSHVQIAAAISLLGTPSIVAFFYALAVLQGIEDFRALNRCMLVFPPLNATALIAMLAIGGANLWLVTTAWVAFYALSAAASVFAARRSVRRVSTDEELPDAVPGIRQILAFGLKALLGSMSPLTGFQLDQAIVGLFISQAALGIYVVAVAFTNLPRFVAQSVGLVAYPHVAASRGDRGQAREILKFTALTLVLCGSIVGVTEFALPFIVPRLFGHAFASAVGVARILLISSLLFCLTRVLSDCSRGAGRPALGTVAEIVSLTTLFPFVAILSGSGTKGVAAALALSAGCGVVVIVVGLANPGWLPRSRSALSPSEEAAVHATAETPVEAL